jgi:hypothetical protein
MPDDKTKVGSPTGAACQVIRTTRSVSWLRNMVSPNSRPAT